VNSKTVLIWVGIIILVAAVSVAVTLAVVTPVQLAPNAAPWWGTPLFTLAGGIGGALLAGGFTLWNERQKREAEATRAEEQLERTAAAKFLEVAAKHYSSSLEFRVADSSELGVAWTTVQLVANEKIVDAGFQYVEALDVFNRVMLASQPERNPDLDTDDERGQCNRWCIYQRGLFRNVLRERYGIAPITQGMKGIPKKPERVLAREQRRRDVGLQ
jgi:hypothetical protein